MELWWGFDCEVLKIYKIWIARKSAIYKNLKFMEFCLDCYKVLIFSLSETGQEPAMVV